jgi:uncharacterized protein
MTARETKARFTSICALFLLSIVVPAAGLTAEAASSQPAGQEVRFRNGDLALAGLYFLPPGDGPFPAAVIISGSGPSNRESAWAHAFIDILLASGIAVLLPDKRGSDGSGGDWQSADFDELATDALAAADYLRTRRDVQAETVGLVGLSQGGKIAPVAAARTDAVAFVIDIAGASTSFVEQISWEMYHTFREAGVEGEALQEALELQVLAEKYVGGELDWNVYKAARDAALEGPGAAVAEDFPSSPESWQWSFFRGIADFDPLPAWRRLQVPVLIVYGEDDANAPAVRSTYRLIRAFIEEEHPDWTVRVIPGAGHGLWNPASTDPQRPELHPDVIALLRSWIRTRITGDGTQEPSANQ